MENKDVFKSSQTIEEIGKEEKKNEKLALKYEKNEKKRLKNEIRRTRRECKVNIAGKKRAIVGLSVATGILGLSTLGFGIGYAITQSQANSYSVQLNNLYMKNYYELEQSINSADMQISKLLASDSSSYQSKMLTELSQTAKEMQSNVAVLPISSDSIVQTVRFINQLSGYTQILEEKIAKGGELNAQDVQTLNDIHECLTEMKRFINNMSIKMSEGYSILDASSTISGDQDVFSMDFSQIKAEDADFPTMIYDGPFSDSTVNQKVVGLVGREVSKEDAYKKVDSVFKNISNLKYSGQTNGKFNSYNFELLTSNNKHLFVQVSKVGGNILTVSGNVESESKSIDLERAKKIALDFVKQNQIENAQIVWFEELENQAYFNIAPLQDGVVLYPDLVKVKVDMENADVVGYDAMTYWTNHTTRTLSKPTLSIDEAQTKIPSGFEIKMKRLVLSPLDFNRQVLTYEFECEKNGATYYFYVNADTNVVENILKVVKTSDSSKLM